MTSANVENPLMRRSLEDRQKEYLWPCVATYYDRPLVLERGQGMYVWDREGTRYLDCFGGVLTTSVGHSRPEVVNAVSDQVRAIAHTSALYINEPQVDLAEKVVSITPGNLRKSFFTNSGTEADEARMSMNWSRRSGPPWPLFSLLSQLKPLPPVVRRATVLLLVADASTSESVKRIRSLANSERSWSDHPDCTGPKWSPRASGSGVFERAELTF